MKRRATRTHQKQGVGNYEKTSDMKIGLLCVLTVLAGDFAMLVFDFMLL
jgi:hypothetical protein